MRVHSTTSMRSQAIFAAPAKVSVRAAFKSSATVGAQFNRIGGFSMRAARQVVVRDSSVTCAEASGDRKVGEIKFYLEQKRYGFLLDGADQSEYFVHFSNMVIEGDPGKHSNARFEKGTPVEFDVKEVEGGRQEAANVTAIGGEPLKNLYVEGEPFM